MVAVRVNELTATWDGQHWTSSDAGLARLLNAVRTVAAGYKPAEVNARAMLTETLGPTGWTITGADPEPSEPGIVY